MSGKKKLGGSAGLAAIIKMKSGTASQRIRVEDIIQQKRTVWTSDDGNAAPVSPTSSLSPVAAATPIFPVSPKNADVNVRGCHVCEKEVLKVDETQACGLLWHNACFKCGGSRNDSCGKVLRKDKFREFEGQPYCDDCHAAYSAGSKPSSKMGRVSPPPSLSSRSASPPPVVSAPSQKSPPPPPRPPVAPLAVAPPPPAAPVPAVTTSLSPPRTVSPPPSASTTSLAKPPPPLVKPASSPTPKYTPTNNTVTNTETPKCTSCAKSVYKMEEIIAVGRIWHTTCFTCGGTKGDGCNRTLKRDGYVDHANQPYCNPCYAKLFRPKGFNLASGINTDYGPAPTESTSQKSESTSQKSGSFKGGWASKSSEKINVGKSSETQETTPSAQSNVLPPPRINGTVPAAAPQLNIGKTEGLYKEASYVGDNDEVDESEWD